MIVLYGGYLVLALDSLSGSSHPPLPSSRVITNHVPVILDSHNLYKHYLGYTGSLKGEASVYGHSQPAGPSASTTQECVFSPATSSMALFAHHAQVAANPNPVSTMTSRTSHLSHGVTQRIQNIETANQMTLTSSQDGKIPPPANQPARCRRKLITPEIVLKMAEKREMLMSLGEIAAAMGFAKSTVAATLQAHTNCGPLLRRPQLVPVLQLKVKKLTLSQWLLWNMTCGCPWSRSVSNWDSTAFSPIKEH
ncbi:hypothetical protein DSO57_1007049 [Entomophthora muscae]|uniref:Uncharacterized protein n=1 Tax=Entomophthora muscae TaxID=34485 RepID=A0ACC2S9A1_9FUNG|nr:hypothetical protein DSO57_1007049 [Entomophthora muscae]